jgi:cytochrome c553
MNRAIFTGFILCGAACAQAQNGSAAAQTTPAWAYAVNPPALVKVEEGGTEPIGQRIIEMPEHLERTELRDSDSGFVAYVPMGSIKKGEALVMTGGAKVVNGKILPGQTIQCAYCHGPDLRGLGSVPPIAGRSPSYTIRQLYDMQHGNRVGPGAALMKAVVANLTQEDMVAIVAYTSSRKP